MSEKTYEMLWDCRYCGTRKNLGKTHRHCPACGGEQDVTARYFPPEEEKVAVEDHVFVGADLFCPACRNPCSARARCCGACGSPLEGAAAVGVRAEVVVGPGGLAPTDSAEHARHQLAGAPPPMGAPAAAPAAEAGMSTGKKAAIGCGCLAALAVVVLLLVAVLWKKDAQLSVSGHRWQRSIPVERFGPTRDKAWCDELPAGAREISRAKEQRGSDKVQDGEDCKTRKVDQGDGTYKEKRECTPRMVEKPKYADRCTIEIDTWSVTRTEVQKGDSVSAPRSWPTVTLARTGSCVGCEREGKRSEEYTVLLKDAEGQVFECALPEARWSGFAVGKSVKAQVRVLGGGVDCDTLVGP